MFPRAKVIVGGIYASLMPEHCKEYTGCDEVFQGVHEAAEKCPPAYDLIFKGPIPYQVIHSSRGCVFEDAGFVELGRSNHVLHTKDL
jgi:hypothetical protein